MTFTLTTPVILVVALAAGIYLGRRWHLEAGRFVALRRERLEHVLPERQPDRAREPTVSPDVS